MKTLQPPYHLSLTEAIAAADVANAGTAWQPEATLWRDTDLAAAILPALSW